VLILSRYRDEIIDVTTPDGTVISVMVTDIERGRVSLGIEAPRECLILRRELKDREPRKKKDGQSPPKNAA
jgi:carbon storage regulator CsrA